VHRYIERGLEFVLFVLSPLLRRVRRTMGGGARGPALSVKGFTMPSLGHARSVRLREGDYSQEAAW
jgi:hypothetical protein